jgi:hypothetical protein
MPRKEYLSSEDRTRLDYPPELVGDQRNLLMQLPDWARQYLRGLQTPTNQVGFLLQLGYFRVVSRFFVASRYPIRDIDYVIARLLVDPNGVQMESYSGRTFLRHQKDILHYLGYQAFDNQASSLVLQEAKRLVALQTQPTLILEAMVGYLDEHRIEVPAYPTLRSLLEDALYRYEKELEKILLDHLRPEDKTLLDSLLKQHTSYQEDERSQLKIKRYELTFFKRISQSMQPSVIKGRVENFERLKNMHGQLLPVIERLGLSQTAVRFYAEYVIDNQVFQVADRTTMRYLLLIAFIIHQYYQLGDALIITFNQAVLGALGDCETQIKESLYEGRLSTAKLVNAVTIRSRNHIDILQEVDRIIHDSALEATQKVALIDQLLEQKKLSATILTLDGQRLTDLKTVNSRINEREDFFETLEKVSVKLQVRVSDIVKVLVADTQTSQKDILEAWLYFQQKDGVIAQNASVPMNFLSLEERQKVLTPEGKLRTSLYKVLLFREIRDHLRSGALNIHSSYEYRSFEEYLISRSQWLKEKDTLLQKACLTHHLRAAPTLLQLNERLNHQFKVVNERLDAGENPQVYFDEAGQWHLHRYRAEVPEETEVENLYPQHRAVSLLEVLTTIDNLTGFKEAFQHKGLDYLPARPANKFFYATIMGLGCNIGIRKMSLISRGVPMNGLETTAIQYFSPDMTLQANDRFVAFSNSLPLTAQFQNHPGFVHTASDGQKYDISVASLRAAWSFKYFGHGKGVTVYTHLDEAGQLIYSTVFSSDHREALYVLNGLMHNGVIN